MKSKKAQAQIFLNPKTVTYILGGALIGYFVFQSFESALIGGVIGLIISFLR